jgi:signal peptidase I
MLKKLGTFILDILEVIVFSFAIFLFVYLLILQPHKIRGASMEPNFPDGEYLLTDKVTYRFREPERGDVIVFEAPGTDSDEFIKRIIALPGENISIKEGKAYINGQLLNENYLPQGTYTSTGQFLKEGEEKQVPADNYFVLGDNRGASSDSRQWGFVSKGRITGRAWVVYWPPSSAGVIKYPTYSF